MPKNAGFAHILLVIFPILGLVITLFVIKDPTNLLPRAYQDKPSDVLNYSFSGVGKLYTTQDFPGGVYVTLCRGAGTAKAGVWQFGPHPQEANYLYEQDEDRCTVSTPPETLQFTQPVPDGAYVKLCVPDQSSAWVWLVDNDTSASLLDHRSEPFSRCSAQSNNNSGSTEPQVLWVDTYTTCDSWGPILNWKWEVKNADKAVAWVYGPEPIFKQTNEVDYLGRGEATVDSQNEIAPVSGGEYQLQLKAVNSSGEESAITSVSLTAASCDIKFTPISGSNSSIPSGCPATGRITTPFGYNIPEYPNVLNEGCGGLPFCHNGVDIAADRGAPITSTIDGEVIVSTYEPFYKGFYIMITNKTSNVTILYEHMLGPSPYRVGNLVRKGDIVGYVGASGSMGIGVHLHYAVKQGGTLINPILRMPIVDRDRYLLIRGGDGLHENDYRGAKPRYDERGNHNWGYCSNENVMI